MTTWLASMTHHLFLKIAEPRVVRLMLFVVYICMFSAGAGVLADPPRQFSDLIGHSLVYALGYFLLVGGLFSFLAVLPGVWWLERVGIIALITGLSLYIFVIQILNWPVLSILITITIAIMLVIRWLEIKRFQLAPLEPKER